MATFMGVEYCIEVGFRNETHPCLIHVPTRITQLKTRINELESNNKDTTSLKEEIQRLRDYNKEYMPTH